MQNSDPASVAKAAFATLAILAISSSTAWAGKYKIIHNFTGGADGAVPGYTLASDGKGNFIGTANQGGANGEGTVFRLEQKNTKWHVRTLYDFTDSDGQPGWGVALHKGGIYTIGSYASVQGGPCGSALQLNKASGAADAPERSEVLMRTYLKSEEGCPTGNLVFDHAGNAYGVTQNGGANGWGSIVELSPTGSGWKETILYSFRGQDDGGAPYSEMVMDAKGNLYGTASACASGCFGTVFELSPSQTGWTYSVLHTFLGGNDGGQPVAALTFDPEGNLFGATASFGAKGGGTVFELSPANGTFDVLYSLTGSDGPVAALALDTVGSIYGTNFMDGAYGYGSVFRLSRTAHGWHYKDLHDFTGGSDGGYPGGGVVLDASGNLYGTAVLGGANGLGVLYRIEQ